MGEGVGLEGLPGLEVVPQVPRHQEYTERRVGLDALSGLEVMPKFTGTKNP